MNVVPVQMHDEIVTKAYQARGYDFEESREAAKWCSMAAWHGIKTHNAVKALHLDHLFGAGPGGTVPGAEIEVLPSRFAAVEKWNANYKLGQSVASRAMERAMQLADEYGVGIVTVDNAFHYLWGGGYVIDAANKGYIAYTNCTTTLAEVVPFKGKYPTIGTNPHSWGFPTKDLIGFNVCIDWATSKIAMGRVQQLKREGKELPPECAIDENGNYTTNPADVFGLVTFGDHKGYGLSLANEMFGAFSGGSLPTIRGHFGEDHPNEKLGISCYFQVTHPDALDCGNFAGGRSQGENVKAVLNDILGHGNENCLFPGQIEAGSAAESEKAGGLLFTDVEVEELAKMAEESGVAFDRAAINKA